MEAEFVNSGFRCLSCGEEFKFPAGTRLRENKLKLKDALIKFMVEHVDRCGGGDPGKVSFSPSTLGALSVRN